MGGVNAKAIGHVVTLTPVQIMAWYAGPMAESRKAAEKEPGGATVTRGPAGEPRGARPTSVGEMKAAFAGFAEYRDRPDEWWEMKFAQFKAGASGG